MTFPPPFFCFLFCPKLPLTVPVPSPCLYVSGSQSLGLTLCVFPSFSVFLRLPVSASGVLTVFFLCLSLSLTLSMTLYPCHSLSDSFCLCRSQPRVSGSDPLRPTHPPQSSLPPPLPSFVGGRRRRGKCESGRPPLLRSPVPAGQESRQSSTYRPSDAEGAEAGPSVSSLRGPQPRAPAVPAGRGRAREGAGCAEGRREGR